MSQFAVEALFIGTKEGLKLSLTMFLVLSYFRNAGMRGLHKTVYAGVLTVFAASVVVLTAPASLEFRETVVRLIGYTFGMFYLISLGALFHATGTDMLGPLGRSARTNIVLIPLVFLLTVLYYVPDMAGSSLYVADLFFMSGRRIMIFLLAAGGMFASASVFFFLLTRYGRKIYVPAMFGLPQVLLFLALMKLMVGGVRGFAELSLIPSVQSGLIKLVHDIVHQTFVTVMVPDHPILTTTTWNFIGVLFGNALTLWLSLIVLVVPLLVFIKKHFSEVAPVSPELGKGAPRRLYIKSFRDARLLKSIPVFAFLIVIVSVWFVQQGERVTSLYQPEPKPVAATDGVVTIPLNAPGEDLLDGSLHKYSLAVKGETYRLLVMKKPDGTLSLCLDACEICLPEGYGQGREHIVCLYCKTPIPFDAVGKPGGCNPIPVTALVTEKEIRVEVSEIEKKWRTVNSAKNGELTGK